jgi:translation initiation factor IF-2
VPLQVSDVDLAAASGGLVLGFNLTPDGVVEEHAKRLGVKLMTYKVSHWQRRVHSQWPKSNWLLSE